MASKPINIRAYKIMYSIVLQTIFHDYMSTNYNINTSFVSPDLS